MVVGYQVILKEYPDLKVPPYLYLAEAEAHRDSVNSRLGDGAASVVKTTVDHLPQQRVLVDGHVVGHWFNEQSPGKRTVRRHVIHIHQVGQLVVGVIRWHGRGVKVVREDDGRWRTIA